MTSCSFAVRTMRACAQGELEGLAPGGTSGKAFAPPKGAEGLGCGTPPNSISGEDFFSHRDDSLTAKTIQTKSKCPYGIDTAQSQGGFTAKTA